MSSTITERPWAIKSLATAAGLVLLSGVIVLAVGHPLALLGVLLAAAAVVAIFRYPILALGFLFFIQPFNVAIFTALKSHAGLNAGPLGHWKDAVIVARNKNSVIGADAYNYKVMDAVNDHFGYGNPKVTVDFNANDPIHNLVLLVIHGAGKDGWRAATPKAKFVLINVPFERVHLGRGKVKKVTVDAIRVEETDTVSSLLFWDGKKYRYIPGGGSL